MKIGRTVGAVGGGGTAVMAVAELGWPGLIVVVGVLIVVLALTAWVLDDLGRSSRLAMLIRALRERV